MLASPDPNVAYPVDTPARQQDPRTALTAEVQPSELPNRGYPAVVQVSGGDAPPSAGIASSAPNTGAWAAANGSYRLGLDWRPLAYMGLDGTAGGWTITVTDLATGQRASTQLDVVNDADTPAAARWPEAGGLPNPPTQNLKVEVGSTGNMCAGGPEISEVFVTGADPAGGVSVYYLDPSGRQFANVGATVNLAGESGRTSPIFWDTNNCDGPDEYEYTVIAVDASGNQAKSRLLLTTGPAG